MYKPKQVQFEDDFAPHFDKTVSEIKYDGERNLLIIKDGQVTVQRHEGRVKSDNFPEIVDFVKQSNLIDKDVILDGEVCVLESEIRADFPAIQKRGTVDPVKVAHNVATIPVTFVAFDIVEINGKDLEGETFKTRRQALESVGLAPISDFKQNNVVIIKSGTETITKEFVKEHDLEGVVMKNPDKTHDWIKLKNYDQDDFEVFGSELTATGQKNGNTISAVHLKNDEGREVGNCCFITNRPIEEIVNRKVRVRFMKTDAYRQGSGGLRFPVFQRFVDETDFEKKLRTEHKNNQVVVV